MIARMLAIGILVASVIGLLVLALAEGLDPAVGLPLVFLATFYGYNKMARQVLEPPRPTRRERRRLRRIAADGHHVYRRDSFDRKRWTRSELTRGSDVDAIIARDQAHNRLGL